MLVDIAGLLATCNGSLDDCRLSSLLPVLVAKQEGRVVPVRTASFTFFNRYSYF